MRYLKSISLFCLCFLIGLASCLFVACGKDENEIKINEVTHSIFYAPLYAAINLGYFEEEGLKVTLESNDGSHTSMSVLLSGNCEVALVGPETVVYANETKDKPLVFGQLTQKDGSYIVSKTPIENFTLDMLKNKTIIGGRDGGLPAMTLQYVIENAGLKIGTGEDEVNLRKDVQFANIATEFRTTDNEFCTLFEPTATTLQNAGAGYIVSSVGEFSGLVPYTCFVAKESYLKSHPEQAEKFLRAVMKGYTYLTTKEASLGAAALKKSFPAMSQGELEIAVKQYSDLKAWSPTPKMEKSSFETLVKIINQCSGKTYNPVFENCVDNSIAEKLA